MDRPLYLVDVFARERYAGNQLAVVTDAAGVDDEAMQDFAAEIDFSETTFVEAPAADPAADGTGGDETGAGGPAASSSAGTWPVRIFTPEAEIPFAGHPTLGTAHVIREHLAAGRPDEIVLDLGVGEVPVRAEEVDGETDADDTGEKTLWMTQQPPEFGERLDHAALAAVLGLEPDDLDPEWPVRVVSTGLPTIVVPLADRDALERIDLDRAAYDAVTGDREAKNVLAVCREPREAASDFAVRVFAPFYGVPEDPATGSSNGCLAGYLVRHGDGDSVAVRVEQGYEMGRPSVLHLRASDGGTERAADGDGGIQVEVGGRVRPVAEGRLG